MKFLTDGMLGNITRWLRLLGYDVEYESVKDDRALLLRSMIEDRILLTADIELFRLAKRRGLEAVLIKGFSTAETLSRLSRKLKLQLDFDELKSRCPICGSPIARATKRFVQEKIPKRTYETYNRFWACTNPSCAKVYWRGSHWKKIRTTLIKAREGNRSVKETEP